MKYYLLTIAFAFFLVLSTGAEAKDKDALPRWAAYAGDAPWTDFTAYDVLAFSPYRHPQLRPLKGWGKTLYARLRFTSDGKEAAAEADVYSFAEVENPAVIKQVIERDIPELVRAGFDGVVLDMDHRERDLLLASQISVLMKLLHIHYPYLRVVISLPYEHLFEDFGGASDLLIAFDSADPHISNENINTTIENIKNLMQLKPQHRVWIMLLSETPQPQLCLSFLQAGISCHVNNHAWTYRLEKE